jgi:hypothetical protein
MTCRMSGHRGHRAILGSSKTCTSRCFVRFVEACMRREGRFLPSKLRNPMMVFGLLFTSYYFPSLIYCVRQMTRRGTWEKNTCRFFTMKRDCTDLNFSIFVENTFLPGPPVYYLAIQSSFQLLLSKKRKGIQYVPPAKRPAAQTRISRAINGFPLKGRLGVALVLNRFGMFCTSVLLGVLRCC